MAAKRIWSIDLSTGDATELSRMPSGAKPRRWTEADLHHCLVLAPQIVGLAEHLPLVRYGGSTSTTPDQLYIDELGRLAVLELKNEPATMHAVAQVLGHSEHWRVLPHTEVDYGFRSAVRPGRAAQLCGRALASLRGDGERDDAEYAAAGAEILRKRENWWHDSRARNLYTFAENRLGAHALAFTGVTPRLMVLAPSFGDDVIAFAREMSDRFVNLELVAVQLYEAPRPSRVLVEATTLQRNDQMEQVWGLLRDLWKREAVRKRFAFCGWADELNMASFSLAANNAPPVKLWINVHEGNVGHLMTVVPDNWHKDDKPARAKLRKALLDRLPKGFDPKERWLQWELELPGQRRKMLDLAEEIARALHEVLVPALPEDMR